MITQLHPIIGYDEHEEEVQEPQEPCPCLGIQGGFLEEAMFTPNPKGEAEIKEAERMRVGSRSITERTASANGPEADRSLVF